MLIVCHWRGTAGRNINSSNFHGIADPPRNITFQKVHGKCIILLGKEADQELLLQKLSLNSVGWLSNVKPT
ncbi:hypothetical protein ACET3Z_021338 [Daucus carota]